MNMKLIIAATLAFATTSAFADTGSAKTEKDEWQFEFTPFVWGAKNEGESGAYRQGPAGQERGKQSEVDIDFQTLIDHTDAAFMGNFNARKDNWLLYSELIYLDVNDKQSLANYGGQDGNVHIDIEGYVFDMGVGYKVYESSDTELYSYIGARAMEVDTNIQIETANGANQAQMGSDWVDPLVGIHVIHKINNTFAVQGRLETGGFGVGSDESYLVSAVLDHKLSENWSLKYFYRYMEVDYKDQGFIYNMEISGPGMGITYRF
ncbi:hypothetical protein E2K93_00960 [Thalassotalea sp. HSM 43]|uniref:hypothetical protein n=1 Tax=Thalassotalea sp. HSM 43 TaxID=2552945 RepID=UPI00107FE403|nr:hypothetical protein [Thalassotalea sp. HSM 43]QBY03027.1 hypothetical protein E2K93_00960 [Thalassotalea sp. HSM 43]